jgi:hypothetical protein
VLLLLAVSTTALAEDGQDVFDLVSSLIDDRNPVDFRQYVDGSIHIGWKDGMVVGYARADSDGRLLFSPVKILSRIIVEGVGVGTCRGGKAVLAYGQIHSSARYIMVDENGSIVDSGVLTGQRSYPRMFMAPDSNPVVWGCNTGKNMSPRFNLSTILEHGEAKVYSFTEAMGVHTGRSEAHMVDDSTILILGHRLFSDSERYKKPQWDWPNLAIYKYNTWLERITESTIVPLDKNPEVLSDDAIPFDGVQVVDDTSGNMTVFVSYVDPEYGLHLRVFTLTPDLKVLPPPKFDIRHDQPPIEIEKGTKHKRLFWFTHNHFWATTTGFHQIALVGDTLLHQKIYEVADPKNYGAPTDERK